MWLHQPKPSECFSLENDTVEANSLMDLVHYLADMPLGWAEVVSCMTMSILGHFGELIAWREDG